MDAYRLAVVHPSTRLSEPGTIITGEQYGQRCKLYLNLYPLQHLPGEL
jgi:hypothetical protein